MRSTCLLTLTGSSATAAFPILVEKGRSQHTACTDGRGGGGGGGVDSGAVEGGGCFCCSGQRGGRAEDSGGNWQWSNRLGFTRAQHTCRGVRDSPGSGGICGTSRGCSRPLSSAGSIQFVESSKMGLVGCIRSPCMILIGTHNRSCFLQFTSGFRTGLIVNQLDCSSRRLLRKPTV
jgi:hypothetical protein